MDVQQKIGALFPSEKDIPREFQIAQPITQDVYLVNGELHPWDGPWQDVYSPVHVADGAGLAPKFLGRYPLMPTAKAEEVLAAAVRAFDHGRGLWPTLSVRERIKYTEDFVYRFREKREEVVRIMMWEIGKSLTDSAQRVRPDGGLYCRHHRGLERPGPGTAPGLSWNRALSGRSGGRPWAWFYAWGPFNYPLNETFTLADSGPDHGQHRSFSNRRSWECCSFTLPGGLPGFLPAGGDQHHLRAGPGDRHTLMALGQIDVLAFIGTSKPAD